MALTDALSNNTARLMDRAALVLTIVALVGSSIVLLVVPLLAFRWAQLPFMGAFVEQTLVFNGVGPQGRTRWSGIDAGLRFPQQLTAIADVPVNSTDALTRALAARHPGETLILSVLGEDGVERLVPITLQTFPTADMFAYFVVSYLIALAYLGIGLWVFRLRWGEAAGRTFALFCASVVVIVGGLFDLYTTHVLSWAWTLAIPLAGGSLLTLALVFPQESFLVAHYPALRWLGFVPAGILAVLGELALYDMERPAAYAAAWANEFAFAGASILVFVGFTVYRRWRTFSPIAREQARIILLGSALAFGPVSYYIMLVTVRGPSPFNVSVYFPALVIFPLAVGYAILRYRLLDTDRLVARGLVYAVLVALAWAGYVLLLGAASIVIGAAIPVGNPLVIALFVVALVVVFNPLYTRLRRWMDRLLFRGSRAYREHLQAFGRELTTAADMRSVVRALRRHIEDAVRPVYTHIYIRDATGGDFVVYAPSQAPNGPPPPGFDAGGDLARKLASARGALYLAPDLPLPSDLARDRERLAALGSCVFIVFPIRNVLIGWLALGEKLSGEPYSREDLRFLEALGDQTALAIERARLFETEREQRELAQALQDTAAALNSTLNFEEVLDRILANVDRVMKHDSANIMLVENGVAHVVRHRGYADFVVDLALLGRTLPVASMPALRHMAASGQPIVVPDTDAFPGWVLIEDQDWVRSYASAPIRLLGEVIGFLNLNSATKGFFSPSQAEHLQAFAEQAGIAIENAKLFKELEHSNASLALAYDATLKGWVRALDLRDEETEGHTQRVTEITVRLARAMGFDEDELVHIRRGALLHDIGKMGIPDSILHKPGPLTDEEWETMQLHPIYAYEMLVLSDYLLPALDIPYCHHEKWDGSGYPRGLQGEQIPLAARVFAVVDVWDALRNDRPYRASWPVDKVRAHIRALAGTHFDPQVVEIFLSLLPQLEASSPAPGRSGSEALDAVDTDIGRLS